MEKREKDYLDARAKELEGRKQPSKRHEQPIVQKDGSGKVIYREEQ